MVKWNERGFGPLSYFTIVPPFCPTWEEDAADANHSVAHL